ncbi:FAD:protein FMN transferase [Pontiella sulfatireligans]|uniref:FAD:protein FMN transferase n=1 Tax=Pontiella sulfatireligans TaxID=2750658 RepID=A0A6C2UT46_9BACT|nr:FAD:protein FMN transferase [Pontiella sulfatireligans]VGO23319.1 FAD:protein FMN transferase [Pontiella sulfatireligans]
MTRKKVIQMIAGLVLVLVLGIGSYWRSPTIENPAHWGETMGTTYSVKITGPVKQRELKRLTQLINQQLAEVNRQMSTWDAASEISRFNHSDSTEPFRCSDAFAAVVGRALELSGSSGGAFDPTLQPLLNLWGFGSEGAERQIPADAAIAKAKAQTGWRKLTAEDGPILRKSTPELSLALGAIAKGYGVDELASTLTDSGYENWFVEIGGEVVVQGTNPDGVPWKIGIQKPTTNPMEEGQLQGIVHITNGAVATSGDYRNYILEDGVVYSHILDPRSGRAVLSDTASVTVAAPNCMDADGLATALFVMGADEGLPWVERQPDVEALFLTRGASGEIFEKFSSGFVEAAGYIPNY